MVTINRQPTPIEAATDVVHSGVDRARDVVEHVAENIAENITESAQEIVEAAEHDADDLGASIRRVTAAMQRGQPECEEPVEDAKDAERLRSAIIAGIVLLVLSAVVFLIARRIVSRREERRLERRRSRVEPTEGGAVAAEATEAAEPSATAD